MIVQFPDKLAQAKMLAMGDSTVDCIFCIISRTFHWAVIPGSSSSTMICNPPQFQIALFIPVLRPNSIYTLCISATFWVEPRLHVDHHSLALALASRAAAALAAASSTHTRSAKTPLPEMLIENLDLWIPTIRSWSCQGNQPQPQLPWPASFGSFGLRIKESEAERTPGWWQMINGSGWFWYVQSSVSDYIYL